ncbi:MAG: anti-sigma factor [Gemmatimonadetes bacterium]|nr:anti-sigma factor [Gemmatimonadota bacterium]NIU29939.1 anti-sigma factor [Gemmatimonadota bacterium]NIV60348.1 anti-sigma factor [Gemmatimonadota bacterium]NIW63009.1 anti-sigma factor [Gemmatimonadota bacterium]
MISCQEALRLVNEYLDGELEGVPAFQVRRHFEACARCYPHLRFESAYREAVRRATAGQSAPPRLKEEVVRLLVEARPED